MADLKSNVTAGMAAASAPYVGAAEEPGPDTCSADHKSMQDFWAKVACVTEGTKAMREAKEKYLPKFELESEQDYKTRVAVSPFTNVYEDISRNLSAKPFSREVAYEDDAEVEQVFKDLYEDIDGRGNNLHVFAESTFQEGVDNALDWILIDFTKLPPLPEGRASRTQSEDAALGARPYWVHVAAPRVVAAYSDMVRGEEIFTHFRILEPTLVRTKYSEEMRERVRIFDREEFEDENGQTDYKPATWRVEEKQKDKENKGKVVWKLIDNGVVPIEIIPVVPFVTGKRRGNGWSVKPVLGNLLDMQIDAFQQESNKRNIELLVCYPMLAANGVQKPQPNAAQTQQGISEIRVPVGPRAVLWAPPQNGGTGSPGNWQFIEPNAESLKFLQSELNGTWSNMREIGMQPMAEANITVITSANVSVKAKSVLQALALRLKDTLEQAMEVTALWLSKAPEDAPGVDVYKDFGVDLQSGKELDTLVSMADKGKLSGETLRAEAKRRNVLGDGFNEEEEQERMALEAAGAADPTDDEGDADPETGEPLSPANDAEPGAEPVDPAEFSDASEIDDETLLRLFGKTSAEAA